MRQTVNRQQSLHRMFGGGSLAGLATSIRRQGRSAQAPDLRLAFTPAAQGTSAAADQVPTAADFPWICSGIPGTARQRIRTAIAVRPGIPAGHVSSRLLLRPASQGGVAVADGVPAAATFCGSTHSPRLAASGTDKMATHSAGRPVAAGYGSTLSAARLSPPSQGRLAAVEHPSTAAIFLTKPALSSNFCKTRQAGRTGGPRSAVTPEGTATPVPRGNSAAVGSRGRRQPPLSRPCLTHVAPNGGGAT